MIKFDIIIIGGGISGLTLANLLANSELNIALVDQQAPPTSGLMQPADARVSAINHASQAIFATIGIWPAMQQLRVSDYHTMRVWDANSPATITFDRTELAQPSLGHIIEHSVMRQTLWQRLTQHPNVHLYHSTQPQRLTTQTNRITVQLSNNDSITAQLVVGADGIQSWVAQQTALCSDKIIGDEYAIIATLQTEHPHQHTAWQRFLSTGPVALLPLTDPHLVSLVWSTTTADAARLMELPVAAFNESVTQATENALGAMQVCDQRHRFPLLRHHVAQYVKPHIALIGDAAHSILPLAGQGMNLGLLDAACLAQSIQDALAAKRECYSLAVLRRYERWRKGENLAMLHSMEGFQRLFSNTTEITRYARHVGFSVTQCLPWLKKYFMQRAAGLRGDLPVSAIS